MKSFLLGLALSLAGAGAIAASATSAHAYDQCIDNVCVGDEIAVISGYYSGERGTVVGVDGYNRTLSVRSYSRNDYIYPSLYEIRVTVDRSRSNCLASVCVNDNAQVISGLYRGEIGRVIGVDQYTYTVTLVGNYGNYITVNAGDVIRYNGGGGYPRPGPYPNPTPICPPGTIYDHYRNVCVRVNPRPPVPRPPMPPRPPLPPRPIPPPPGRPGPGPGFPHPGPGPGPGFPHPGPGFPGPGPRR